MNINLPAGWLCAALDATTLVRQSIVYLCGGALSRPSKHGAKKTTSPMNPTTSSPLANWLVPERSDLPLFSFDLPASMEGVMAGFVGVTERALIGVPQPRIKRNKFFVTVRFRTAIVYNSPGRPSPGVFRQALSACGDKGYSALDRPARVSATHS
jgi:hypothetical protein